MSETRTLDGAPSAATLYPRAVAGSYASQSAAVGVLFAFRTGRIAGLDALRRRTARPVVSAGQAAA